MWQSLMKRSLFAGLLVFMLAFTLVACDVDDGGDDTALEPGVGEEGVFDDDFEDNGDVITGTTDFDDDDDLLEDENEEGLDNPLDDSDEVGIVWNDDEFELKGFVVGTPDLVSNTLTVEANGEQYTIFVPDDVEYGDDLFLDQLMDGDMVEVEGTRDDAGDLWASLIEREDDSDLSDS